jgi:hypothetical protein
VTKLIQFEVEGGGEVLVAAATDVAAGPVYRGCASGLVEKANETCRQLWPKWPRPRRP